jgi:hypothetical protein
MNKTESRPDIINGSNRATPERKSFAKKCMLGREHGVHNFSAYHSIVDQGSEPFRKPTGHFTAFNDVKIRNSGMASKEFKGIISRLVNSNQLN